MNKELDRPTSTAPTVLNDDEMLAMRAVEWVLAQSANGVCPVDGAQMKLVEGEAAAAPLKNHLLAKHKNWCIAAYAQKSLEPSLLNDDFLGEKDAFELGGIEQLEALDKHDMLYVPQPIRDQAAREGGVLRWASPRRARRYLDMGAELVKLPGGNHPQEQRSTEDSTVRSNEMVLVKFPAALALRRRQQKEARIDHSLNARAEELHTTQDAVEKAVYDGLLRQGKDRDTARQVARAVAFGERKRQGQDNFRYGSPKAHRGVIVTDQKGRKDIS